MSVTQQLDAEQLAAILPELQKSPSTGGVLEGIVIRTDKDMRRCAQESEVTMEDGLPGDRWRHDCKRRLPDGRVNPDTQLTLMNTRFLAPIAGSRERWELAGDNLLVDLDLTERNLPVGQRLRIGAVVLEITAQPHTGCVKFKRRFGDAAFQFANAPERAPLRLRGVHAQVIQPGRIRVGDRIEKV